MRYEPRIIRRPGSDHAYLMTCRKDLASQLVRYLKRKDVPATLTGNEVQEQMESADGTEEYLVSEISIEPPADYQKLRELVFHWPRTETVATP